MARPYIYAPKPQRIPLIQPLELINEFDLNRSFAEQPVFITENVSPIIRDDPPLTLYRSISQNSNESIRLERRNDVDHFVLLLEESEHPTGEANVEHYVHHGPLVPLMMAGHDCILQPFCFFPTFADALRNDDMELDDLSAYAKQVPTVTFPIDVLTYYHRRGRLDRYEHLCRVCIRDEKKLDALDESGRIIHLLHQDCVIDMNAMTEDLTKYVVEDI